MSLQSCLLQLNAMQLSPNGDMHDALQKAVLMVCLVNAAEIDMLPSAEIRPCRVLERLFLQTWRQTFPEETAEKPDFVNALRQLAREPFCHLRSLDGEEISQIPDYYTFDDFMDRRMSLVLDDELWQLLRTEDGRRRCWKVLTAVWL